MKAEHKMRAMSCKFSIIKQDTNCTSQTVGQIIFESPSLQLACPKNIYVGILKWFWTVLPGQKKLCLCILRNKYGFKIGNAMEKLSLFWPGINAHNGLILIHKEVLGCANSNGTGFEAVYSDVFELWAISIHYLWNCSS